MLKILFISLQALIELLDEVEDVISVEHQLRKDNEAVLDAERSPKADLVANHLTSNSDDSKYSKDSDSSFLVLEVCTITYLLINSFYMESGSPLRPFCFGACATGFRKAWT